MRVLHEAPGPATHGVVRHAALITRLLAGHGVQATDRQPGLAHAQFTDALWGADIEAAATAFVRWAATAPRPLVVTLHDVPGADPDPDRDRRRGSGYARVVAAADVVVVSAEHEAAKVGRLTGAAATVIPLPVEQLSVDPPPNGAGRPAWADRPTLGVLGFLYPGKGHEHVLDLAARLPGRPRVVAAGTVGAGHEDLATALRRRATAAGVDLVITGWLSDAGLAAAAHVVTVPIVPGRRVSASGSLATWWGVGRRPLAARGEYTAELARRHPAALHLYDDAGLDAAARAALADGSRTRLGRAQWSDAQWSDAGAAHAALYRRVLRGGRPGAGRC